MENYVWKITQSLVFSEAEQHYQSWLALIQKLKGNLTIDLEQVTQCDSSGLALLLETKQWAKNNHKYCYLKNCPSAILSLASFYGLDSILFNG